MIGNFPSNVQVIIGSICWALQDMQIHIKI